MKIMFFMNFLVTLIIFLILSLNFFKHYKKSRLSKAINYLSVIGLFYFFISVISFLWLFDILKYSMKDFVYIYSIVIFIQTLFLCIFVYLFSGKKKVFYYLFIYLIVLISFIFPVLNYLGLFLVASFLLSFLLFIGLILKSSIYKKIAYLGVFYSFISLIFQILHTLGKGELFVLSFFSNIIFLLFLFNFLKNLEKYPLQRGYSYKRQSHFFKVFRSLVFIIILVNFIFIGTVGIHEFGHFSLSKFYECSYRSIVYEGDLPYTEILCKDLSKNNFVLLGGVLLPFFIGICLFIIGGRFLRDIALLVVGFNLLVSSMDFVKLGFSENLIMAGSLFGVLCLIIGVVMLVKSRTEEYVHSIF